MRKTGLTTIPSCAIIIKRAGEKTVKCQDAGIAHLVERRLAKAEVAGSSPVSRSKLSKVSRVFCVFALIFSLNMLIYTEIRKDRLNRDLHPPHQ